MMDWKALCHKSLFRNTAIYTITDGISKSISFIMLPIVSYYLLPEQLGIVANFDVLQSIIMLLAGQAIVNALPYFYYKSSHEEMALLVSNLLFIILLVNAFLVGVVFLLCSATIEKYLHLTLLLQLLTFVSVISNLLIALNMVLFRLEEKPYEFAKLQLVQTFVYVLLIIVLVIGLRLEAMGKIYAAVISASVMALFHAFLLVRRKYIVLSWDRKALTTLLRFGMPLLPHSLSFWIKGGMDKVLLTNFCGLAVNGLYSMAMSFGAVYSIFNTAFNNAYVPYLQKRIAAMTADNKDCEERKMVSLTYKVAFFFVCLCFVAILGCWIVINYILNDKYKLSFEFVPWIMISLTITSFYGLFVQFIYTKKKTFGLGIITFSGSLLQLAITYALISAFGKDGIKYSLVIGSLFIMLGVWIYSDKVYPLPWFSKKWLL